jgi:hypothetical protein
LKERKMKLFISGTKEFNAKPLQPQVMKIRDFLLKSKDGEVFINEQIIKAVGGSPNNYSKMASQISEYTHKVGSKRYWGKPSTIKQLIKETQQ